MSVDEFTAPYEIVGLTRLAHHPLMKRPRPDEEHHQH